MNFLYLILDILFFNFTNFKTSLIIFSIISKKNKYFEIVLLALIIDLFITHIIYFILLMPLLKFINGKIKKFNFYIICFLYIIITFIIFKEIPINLLGIIINLFFLYLIF